MTPSQKKRIFQKAKLISLVISVILPLLVLLGFGVYAVLNSEIAIYIFIATTIVTAICIVLFLKLNARESAIEWVDSLKPKGLAEPSEDWSSQETDLWNRLRNRASDLVHENGTWEAVTKSHSLTLAEEVAGFYQRKNKFDLTSIEALIAVEEISKRFRRVLRKNVPMIEQLSFAQIVALLDFKDKYGAPLMISKDVAMSIKFVGKTIFNPVGQVFNSMQQRVLDQLLEQLGAGFNARLKATFLEECLSVYIDIYSGRFSVANDEVKVSKLTTEDNKNYGIEVEPVRIAIVGQVSTGKSSLTNLICESLVAEVDLLPSTDKSNIYTANIEGVEQLKLVDLPGLDSSDESQEEALKQITNSDIVLWVLRANQQARQLDKSLLKRVNDHYSSNPNRKPPQLLGVLTHIDKLIGLGDRSFEQLSPQSSEQQTLNDLIAYNRELLGIDNFSFIAKASDRCVIGFDGLSDHLSSMLAQAKQAQLNRRRIDSHSQSIADQFKRIFHGATSVTRYFKGD